VDKSEASKRVSAGMKRYWANRKGIGERCMTVCGIHIPGCMGCAAMGHDRCTCPSPKERSKDVDARLSAIERRLLEIEKIVYRKEF